MRKLTMRYVRAHTGRLPAVIVVRWARVVGLYERGREVVAARVFYKRERPLAEITSLELLRDRGVGDRGRDHAAAEADPRLPARSRSPSSS